MSVSEATAEQRNGLLNVMDIVIAPGAAFARLRRVPAWGWAYLVGALLMVAGSLLAEPAVLHAIDTGMPGRLAANPQIQRLPAERAHTVIQQQLTMMHAIARFSWIFAPVILLLTGLIQALVMTVANAIGRGDGSFAKYFALSVTAAVPSAGLAALVLGIITSIRGADSFDDITSLQAVIPSVGMLAPGTQGAARGFLQTLTIFNLWGTALLALGMTAIGRVPRGLAWGAAAFLLLCFAAYAAFGAAHQ